MERITVVKVGGAVVEDEASLHLLLTQFAAIPGNKVLVHGGGRRATKVAEALGLESRMVNGRRVTDRDMLDVVTMVYGGLVNKHIVARLQACGINAIGLTGADMNVVRSHRRPPVTLVNQATGTTETVDYGYVGDVERVDPYQISSLVHSGATPVMAPLTHDGNGHILNTNADTIAAEAAKSLAELFRVTLVYCFEKPGVLARPDDDNSVIPVISPDTFRELVQQGVISGGMIPKVENALNAVKAGVERVIITRADAIDGRHGTVIKA